MQWAFITLLKLKQEESVGKIFKRDGLIVVALVLIFLMLIPIGCSREKEKSPKTRAKTEAKVGKEKVIKIGAILPLTGDIAMFGHWLKEGILVASTGYKRKVIVKFEDDQDKTSLAVSAFNKLVDIDKVKAIITARTPVANALVPLAFRKKIPIIFTFADLPSDTKGGVCNFHFPVVDEIMVLTRVIGQYVGEKASVITVNDNFGNLARNFFKRYFKGKVIFEQSFMPTEKKFKNIVDKIPKESDFLFLVGYGQNLVGILKRIQERKLTIPIVSINSFTVFYDLVKDYLITPVYVTMTLFDVGKGNNVVLENVKQKFAQTLKKKPNLVNLEAYEASKFLLNLLVDKGFSKEETFEYFSQPKRLDTVFGKLYCDTRGQVHFPLVVVKVWNNKREIISIWRP